MYMFLKYTSCISFLFIVVTSLISCNFDTYKCNKSYVHVYYGGGVGGYRLVVVNSQKSMRFKGLENFRQYKKNNSPKVVYENDNPILVSCSSRVNITTDSHPEVNSMDSTVVTRTVEPYRLVNIDTNKYDMVVR